MILCIDSGIVPYDQALAWQRELCQRRRREEVQNHLLLLEHPPVYTFGRREASQDLRVSKDWVLEHGMGLYKTDRGGRVTYHGPGQLVGYLIFKLNDSIPHFVWKIEESLLRTLHHYQVEGDRESKNPGIWVDHRKIAALGLHIERGVTTHGFALNVTCDLTPFRYIDPCGLKDREVTSIEREIGWSPSIRDVKQHLLQEFASVFGDTVHVQGGPSATTE